MNSITTSKFMQWVTSDLVSWLTEHGIKILGILVAAFIIAKLSKPLIKKAIRKAVPESAFTSKEAEEKREDTLIQILNGTIQVVLWVVVAMMILSEVGISIGPLLAGAGIAGVAFGFGAQYLVRDIISGLFIILENQYRVGDVVELADAVGVVEKLSIRSTIVRDLDGTVHHIPNGQVKTAANMSHDFARMNLNIGVAYDADLEQVIKVINEVGEKFANDPEWKDKVITTPQFLRVDNFGDSSIDVKILGEIAPLEQWSAMGEFRKRLKIAFDKNGIEIPFPQRDVHYKKES